MRQCFSGIEAYGLPALSSSPDYPILNDRFKNGLEKIANSMVKNLPTPKYVYSSIILMFFLR